MHRYYRGPVKIIMKIFDERVGSESGAQHLSFLVTRQLMLPLDLLILIAPHTNKHIERGYPSCIHWTKCCEIVFQFCLKTIFLSYEYQPGVRRTSIIFYFFKNMIKNILKYLSEYFSSGLLFFKISDNCWFFALSPWPGLGQRKRNKFNFIKLIPHTIFKPLPLRPLALTRSGEACQTAYVRKFCNEMNMYWHLAWSSFHRW